MYCVLLEDDQVACICVCVCCVVCGEGVYGVCVWYV